MKSYVWDIETNGLLDVLDKIHVISWQEVGTNEVHHTHDYDEMRAFINKADVLIAHNQVRFDVVAVEKVLGIKVKARLIDTLALSWYLNHDRIKHGLEGYGIEYGVPKPVVTDWDSLTPEDYAHRCDEDVKINSRLWRDLDIKLNRLYPEQQDKDRLIDYLTFKMDCAKEQESLRWKLDVPMAQKAYDEIMVLKDEKVVQLAEAMPKHILTRVATQPKVMRKKDGELSSHGEKWVELCKEYKQPITTQSFVVKVGEELGNPNSSDQVKDWLHGLGWVPRTYKFVRDKKTGEERQIEQVRDDGELCESVKELNEVDPAVDLLDGLTVLTHRAGILKSFLECVSPDGYLKAEIAGLTNTLRFKHSKPLVNLPSVDKPYGDVIRGVLTCPEGYVLAGADMTSLEDTTKRHYMKPLDPDYVEEMSREGFDPHLDLAKFAGVITQDDIDKHNSGERSLKALRKNYKVVNYSATYGIGAAKLARGTGMSSKEAKALLDAFWSRNWSVEAVAKSLRVRELFGSMWLYNPVSHFWYALRSDKDRFSTLNQGTGVFCFDTWVALCRKNGIKTIGQFHDEIIALVEDGKQEEVAAIMHGAAAKLNEKVKLNVPLGCDAQFGKTYASIH
jgi:hypothetical protein